MPQEFIIGRNSDSAIAVPADKLGVSGQHVRIVIDDDGVWHLEDLKSANGTYIRDDNGDYQRVYKKTINRNTVIRLGQQGHNSFTFMASRLIAPDNSYEYEFMHLKKLLARQAEEEEALERRNARNMKIVKAASPIAMALCIGAQYIIPGMKNDANLNLWISRGAMAVAPVAIGMFFGIDARGMKQLKQKRLKILTCPKCNYPVSEFDIQNMQCSRCKAK